MHHDLRLLVYKSAIDLLRALGVVQEDDTGYHIAKSHLASPSQTPSTGGFDDFWRLYPRKVAKVAAQKAWKRQGCDQVAPQIIASMVNHPSFLTSDPLFIPHASTWLNQRRWEDETIIPIKPAVDLNDMIKELEEKQAIAVEGQHAYLRETGILPGNGVSKSSISHHGSSI